MTLRVLVVDDQAMVRTGLVSILEGEDDFDVVGEAGDGASALAAINRLAPDIALMDVRMPVMDGLEATRRLSSSGCTTKVLVLTTFDLDDYVYAALRAGASGFLLKDAPAEELVNAVRVVARGDALLSPSVTRQVIEEFARLPAPQTESRAAVSALTVRELEVLKLLARGLSNHEIAQRLFVAETTVKSHVAHVLMKLDLRDRIQAVVFAYEVGVVRPGQG
ncbi:MAG: response regulator transcription factor [Actinomycetota bacterium]|nr:response regulator transcription factor [Actinomycetota bacterium]